VSYTPSLPDGPHFGLFTGADLAGNQVSAYSVNFFIDTAPPTVSVTAPLSAPDYTSTSVPVDLLVSDPGSGVQSANVQVYLNGVPAGPEVSVSPLDASNVSVTGTLSALVGSNTLSVIGFDNAGNPFNFTASFTVAGSTVPPSFFVPRPVVDIEAITEPPFPDEQPGLFFPTQGRPIYFQVRTKADGTDQEGVIIDPVITSGAGQVFYTPSYPQTSDSSGVAGFGFIPARAGNASITVKSIVGEPGQTTQFNMIVGAIAPVITLLATVEPGSSLVAPVYGGIASRMTVYVDEVDEDHEPIMDPSQRKLTFFNQVYTTEPDGTAYVPIRINSGAWTGQGSAAYMRATFPEFRDEDGNVMKAFTSFSVLNPAISIPTTSISGGNGQTFYPGRPLDQPIVIEAIVPEGQEHTIIQASVFGPGTIQNVSGGRLLTWTPDHKTVVVERPGSGGSLSVQYTADPGQTRAATILTRSIGTFVDPPDGVIMTGSPLAEHAVVLAPQIEYLTGDSELVSISMADVDEILETPIQSERYTRLEARVPFSGVGSSTLEVTLQALGPDGNPLSDDQLFPPVQQTLTLTRVGGSDKFVSGPFVASTERKKIDATPSLPFQAVRLGSFMRAMPVVAALQGVPQQAAPIMSPVLDPPIPARAGPPNDFVELVNGRVNGMDGPGSEGLFLNIDLRPVVPPGAPGPVTIQGQQLQGAVPLQLGDLFVADQGPERTFNRAVTEVARGIHYIFDNPTVNHQQTDLVFTMLGAGLANGNDRVRVPVRLSRYAGTVRITYRYVLSAGEGGVPPFRRLRLDEQHYITNMIWRQAGVRVLNSAVAGVGYRVVPNQPLRITDYDGSQQSVTDFNNMNLQDQTNVTVFYIDNITTHPTAGGLTAVYPANAVKRWCVVTKNAFTFPTVNSGHTAHELGHILGLDDTVVPAGAGVLNLNLMMNQPGQRVMNMLFDINVNTQRTGNENQMTITRAVAGVLNQE
jgi:hypothetical protein